MSCWDCLLKPELTYRGRKVDLPVRIVPRLSGALGRRLHQARKLDCLRVDRRTRDWRHKSSLSGLEGECRCIPQIPVAKALGISQVTYSRIEQLADRRYPRAIFQAPKKMDLTAILSFFGVERTLWILTGIEVKGKQGVTKS